jgi:hypothetical protein
LEKEEISGDNPGIIEKKSFQVKMKDISYYLEI